MWGRDIMALELDNTGNAVRRSLARLAWLLFANPQQSNRIK